MSVEIVEVILAAVVGVLAARAVFKTSRNHGPNRSDRKPNRGDGGGTPHGGDDRSGDGHGGGGDGGGGAGGGGGGGD